MKNLSASKLRQNIYQLLDRVVMSGVPLVILRKGKKLKIVLADPIHKLSRLKKRSVMKGSPESFVHIDWSHEWNN